MRPAAGLALLLAACSPQTSGAPAGERIDCALGGAANFIRDCTVEHGKLDGGSMIIVRHPDGGFRRFTVLKGGKSLALADGAEALAIAVTADGIDVSVDGDRYRFPAAMLADAQR